MRTSRVSILPNHHLSHGQNANLADVPVPALTTFNSLVYMYRLLVGLRDEIPTSGSVGSFRMFGREYVWGWSVTVVASVC